MLQLGLLVLLLSVENRLWGKTAVGQNITERGFVESGVFGNVLDAPPVLMASGEAVASGFDPIGFEDGPNLYAYVQQNPWTSFDPDGLKTKNDYRQDIADSIQRRDEKIANITHKEGSKGWHQMRNRIYNESNHQIGEAKKKMAKIEATARAMEYVNRSSGLSLDAEMMDDEDSTYKSFNRIYGALQYWPGASTADHAMHGEYGQAALSFGGEVVLTIVGGKLVKMAGKGGATGVQVASSAGGETLPMSMVRAIQKGESIANLTNELKVLTFQTGQEHAVVTLANGQRAIVSGGSGGIKFGEGQIKTLFGHTHPTSAPPSAMDATALKQLGQSQQTVLHGGEVTKVRATH